MPNINLYRKLALTLRSPHTAWNVLYDKIRGIKNNRYPRIIDLFVTERCNFACSMCHVRDSMLKNSIKGDLDFYYIKRIIAESKKWSPCFQITGGEPTLYEYLLETMRLISQNRMICGVITNGLFLEEFAKGFISSGLNFLAVSLDGWDEESQRKRGNIQGSFDHILRGISKIIKYRGRKPLPIIRIATVITKNNYQYLDKIWDIVSRLGVDIWSISNYYFVTNHVLELNRKFYEETKVGRDIWGNKIGDSFYFSKDEIKIIEGSLNSLRKKRSNVHIDYNWTLNLNDFYSPKFPTKESKCILSYNELFIRANGDIELCQGCKLGNIASDTISEVWKGKKIEYFRKVFEENKIMPGCFRCCALNMKF